MDDDIKIEDLRKRLAKLEAELKESLAKDATSKIMTKEALIRRYESYGFVVSPGTKFWRIRGTDSDAGKYGMEVGSYVHSCHIDTTDLIVLHIVDEVPYHKSYVESYSDIWLDGPMVV